MTFEIKQKPIVEWPGRLTVDRERSRFKASYTHTLELLDRELWHVDARNIIMQIALEPKDFRITDGLPRTNARPAHPGVILTFDSSRGALSFPCDRFDDWKDNLRAIALSLEALRKIDRYGVTRHAEQYKGWARLEAPGTPADFGSQSAAVQFIRSHSGAADNASLLDHYRAAAKRLHPDAGGDTVLFQRLQKARETAGL